MGSMTSDWRKVADWVVRRRADLGLTQAELAHRAGISLDRIQSIEAVRRQGGYRRTTIAALEKALGWDYGSVDSILGGGNPSRTIPLGTAVETDEARPLRKTVTSREPEEEWKQRIIAEGVAEAKKVLDGMNPDEAEQLLDQMRTLVAGWRARRGELREQRRDVG